MKTKDLKFSINHYAGMVTYDIDNFLEKNRDTLFKDLVYIAATSKKNLLRDIFALSVNIEDVPEGNANSAPKGKAVFNLGNKPGQNRQRPTTAGAQFKVQKKVASELN